MLTTDQKICAACLCPHIRDIHRMILLLGEEHKSGYDCLRATLFKSTLALIQTKEDDDWLWRSDFALHFWILVNLIDACEEDNRYADPWEDDPPVRPRRGSRRSDQTSQEESDQEDKTPPDDAE